LTSIDTNILLYSLNPGSKFHKKASGFVTETLSDSSIRVGITDYVLVELYNHLRNKVVMRKPLSPKKAADVALAFLDAPNVTRIENAPVMDAVWKAAASRNFPRRKIFDVRDFKGLGFARVWNPLAE